MAGNDTKAVKRSILRKMRRLRSTSSMRAKTGCVTPCSMPVMVVEPSVVHLLAWLKWPTSVVPYSLPKKTEKTLLLTCVKTFVTSSFELKLNISRSGRRSMCSEGRHRA